MSNLTNQQEQTPRNWLYAALAIIAMSGATGCKDKPIVPSQTPASAPQWFEEVATKSGIKFSHDAGPVGTYFFPQIMGSGCALFDYDNDGRLDILLIQNGGPTGRKNQLFHQEPDGSFKDVSEGSGLDFAGYGMGVAIGDVNNDGLPDVLITEFGRIRLLINQGGGRFKDVTAQAGLDDPLWATSAAFLDYDRDGWLDLVVVNYVHYDPAIPCRSPLGERDYCSPIAFEGTSTKLYHNLGSTLANQPGAVRFEDVTVKSGIGLKIGPGLGVLCADFDGDRWPDILVANDGKPNHLWINQHDGTFKEEGVLRGVALNAVGLAEANMGVTIGDTDGGGAFDLFVTHLKEETNTLWSMSGPGIFFDRTVASGLSAPAKRATGFGTVLADFQNNGALDLAVVNGGVRRDKPGEVAPFNQFWSQYAQHNQLFRGDGHGHFQEISSENPSLCGAEAVYRGLACGDVYNDGGLALLSTTVEGPAHLHRNIVSDRGHWLTVRAVDPSLGGRDAYGAVIHIQAGGRNFVSWINPGYSYMSSNDPRAHFGFGKTAKIDSVHVIWPDGKVENFPPPAVDAVVVLQRGGS